MWDLDRSLGGNEKYYHAVQLLYVFIFFRRSQDREWGRGCECVVLLPGGRCGEVYMRAFPSPN